MTTTNTPRFWFYSDAFAQPDTAMPFDDTDEEWAEALSDPQVVVDKRRSTAVCGAEYLPGTTSKGADGILWAHGLVLDVDVWRPDRPPFTRAELEERLAGLRFVAWTTYSSTAETPKWRVVVPFATPMPPAKYAALWDSMNSPEILDGTMAPATRDAGRLGFVASLGSEAQRGAYTWFINPGERLCWSDLDLADAALPAMRRALGPADLTRSPDWISDAEALSRAKRYYRDVGVDIVPGDRHAQLLRVAIKCWWDFALDENGVREVVNAVNDNFKEPHDVDKVEAEITAGWGRTLGERRVDQPTPYGCEREPVARATRTALADHAKTLRRTAQDARRAVGRALAGLAKGEAFGEPPEARVLALQAAEEVARLYPREKPDRLLELLTPGLEAQRARNLPTSHPVPTGEEMLARLRWVQNAATKAEEDRSAARADKTRARIATASGGTRTEPYTAQEIRDWEAKGFTSSQWILQHDESFYFRVNDGYAGPFRKGPAANFAATLLAPAGNRLRMDWHDKNGVVKDRPFDDLVREYGSLVSVVERSLHGDQTVYDPLTKKLSLVVSPLRPLTPEYSAEIDEWLKRLAGPKYPLMLDWLATVPLLDRPLVALYLVGETGSGKNLLASGLARLWTDTAEATALEDFLKHPEAAELVPVLLADEGLPQTWDRAASRELRAFVSRGSRMVRQPFLPAYLQLGYPRLILAANESILATHKESYRKRDAIALATRVLMLEPDGDTARRYLASLGQLTRAFVQQDLLAKHVLWLRDNHAVSPTERFGVVDTDATFVNSWTTSSDKNSACFEWLHQFLLQETFATDVVLADASGTLWVYPTGVVHHWAMHDYARRGAREREVSAAFKSLSTGRGLVVRKGHKDTHYRKIDMDKFTYWLEHVVEAPLEPVAAAIVELAQRRPFTVQGFTANV